MKAPGFSGGLLLYNTKMQNFSPMPSELVRSVQKNRILILELIKREVIGRYRGSVMGILWSFFNPVLMIIIYTFVFGIVFKARWGVLDESKTEFALVLFVGLMVFNVFSECFLRAPCLIISNVNYVKKIVFPLEILPLVNIGSAIFHALISVLVWLGFYVFSIGIPPLTILLLPLVVLPLIGFTTGVCWILASLGVYLRDMSQVIGLLNTILLFVSPIFYKADAIPEEIRWVIYINPLAPIIEMTRDVMILGKNPSWMYYGSCLILSFMVGTIGFAWFQKTRKGFADVL